MLGFEMFSAYAVGDNMKNYEIGEPVNAGKDNGYSGNNEFDKNDPHYGWTLGSFAVSGYTRDTKDTDGNPVFIKTLGDKVTLWFTLRQDIDALNGNAKLAISTDKNGYDKYFQTEKTNCGRGMLIIRAKDYQNSLNEPTIYTDYLSAKTVGAETQVELFEEGDYEVAFDYEIKKIPFAIFGKSFAPSYTNYRIFFRFSVRNGNCMVYPFDVKTKTELTNSSITENGFYLDLAKSRYLDINVKKSTLAEGANGLTEDTRFNRPAKDGDEYIEEGIYTIDVSNRYTAEKTTKQIYVGKNNILKAYIRTGLTIGEINEQVALGAKITNDGTIISPPSPLPTPGLTPMSTPQLEPTPNIETNQAVEASDALVPNPDKANSQNESAPSVQNAEQEQQSSAAINIITAIAIVAVLSTIIIIVMVKRRGAK
jgi:hypothetical protein